MCNLLKYKNISEKDTLYLLVLEIVVLLNLQVPKVIESVSKWLISSKHDSPFALLIDTQVNICRKTQQKNERTL